MPEETAAQRYVVYDAVVRDPAENRLATTLGHSREVGIEASGDLMDPEYDYKRDDGR